MVHPVVIPISVDVNAIVTFLNISLTYVCFAGAAELRKQKVSEVHNKDSSDMPSTETYVGRLGWREAWQYVKVFNCTILRLSGISGDHLCK